MQDLRRKPSKPRIVSGSNAIPKPTRYSSFNDAPTSNVFPDTGISEVTTSMAAMLSQESPEEIQARRQRAPTADMTTALSQQRRIELAEEQANAVPPFPISPLNNEQAQLSDHDMSDASDEEILREVPSPREEDAALDQPGSMRAAASRVQAGSGVRSDFVMIGSDIEGGGGLFVTPNPSRAGTQVPYSQDPFSQVPNKQVPNSEAQAPKQTAAPIGTQFTQDLLAYIAKHEEKRDAEVC